MLGFIEAMEYEDREIFWQVMLEVLPKLTAMQRQCLLMSILGIDQSAIGRILGIDQSNVSRNFNNALDIAGKLSSGYL